MSIYFTLKRLLLWAVLTALISSCNTQPLPPAPMVEIESRPFIKNAPDWVNNGSGFMNANGERLIFGVGYSLTVGDLAQQKALADDVARAEVGRLLSEFLFALASRHPTTAYVQASSVPVTGDNAAAHSQVQSAARISQSGTRIAKSWRDPRNNAVWSLALLDIKRVRNVADVQNQMDTVFLRLLEAEADNVFDSFIKQNK